MADYKQCADAARKGPGFAENPLASASAPSAPSPAPAGNAKSGTSQSHMRGKQGE